MTFEGYHGTNEANCSDILRNNFIVSQDDSKWLGNGAYFFVKGISNPINNAKEWAIASAWDKQNKRNLYQKYVVLKSVIYVEEENFLDLASECGLEIFNYLKEVFLNKVKSLGKRITNYEYIDGQLLNWEHKNNTLGIPIDVTRTRVYIKFTTERLLNFNSRTPNVTMLCVANPSKNIEIQHITVELKGDI